MASQKIADAQIIIDANGRERHVHAKTPGAVDTHAVGDKPLSCV
jgi:Na+-translocating ferredoxin:NAD+ oxidoreductase RnfC subunit